MDDGLKKRLLGATVLVSLAVIFVPMLFEKEPADDSGLSESNIPLPPEDRFSSRVLPLEGEALSKPPAQITPLNQVGDESGAPSTSKILALKPEKSPEPEPPLENVAPDALTESEPLGENVTLDTPPASKPPEKEDSAEKPEPSPAKTASTSSWVVQVGSFSNRANAEKIASQLKNKGYPAFIEQADINGNSVFRVRVGPETNRSKVENMLARLDSELKVHKLKGRLKRYP